MDAPELQNVDEFPEAWQNWRKGYNNHWLFVPEEHLFQDWDVTIYLQYENDELSGMLRFNRLSGDIIMVVVDPAKQGKGLASQLVRHASYDLVVKGKIELVYADNILHESMHHVFTNNGYERFNSAVAVGKPVEAEYIGSDSSVDYSGVYVRNPATEEELNPEIRKIKEPTERRGAWGCTIQ